MVTPTGTTMQKILLFLFFFLNILYATDVGVGASRPTEVLPKLVTEGESLKDFDQNFYLDNRSPINAVAISEDGKTIVSGSYDKSIKIWDSGTGK
jgi:WD40 repeat protein